MGYDGLASRWEPARSYWAVSAPQGGGAFTYLITSGLDFDPEALLPEYVQSKHSQRHMAYNNVL